jgi:hypothetical protein
MEPAGATSRRETPVIVPAAGRACWSLCGDSARNVPEGRRFGSYHIVSLKHWPRFPSRGLLFVLSLGSDWKIGGSMSPPDRERLTIILAHAFDRAWEAYYASGRGKVIPEDVARPALAKHLVAAAQEGVTDEAVLAVSGLMHLLSLTSWDQ